MWGCSNRAPKGARMEKIVEGQGFELGVKVCGLDLDNRDRRRDNKD